MGAGMRGETEKTVEDLGFRERYQKIVNTQLSPENIATYADDAINELSSLIADIQEEHKWEGLELSEKEREDKIFEEVLPGENIGDTLDRIDEIAQDLRGIDSIITVARGNPEDRVILSPDEVDMSVSVGKRNGESGLNETTYLPKLKTLLFILEKDFAVDVHDTEQVKIFSGMVGSDMMRTVSYDAVEVPELGRLMLSCDEKGNRTFVFDTDKLKDVNITPEMLMDGTKSQLTELLKAKPELGKSLVYSQNYIERMREAVENPAGTLSPEKGEAAGAGYLTTVEKMPEEYVTYPALMNEIGIGPTRFRKLIADHAEELGRIETVKGLGVRPTRYFNTEQAEKIRQYVQEQSNLAPEGYMTLTTYAFSRGLAPKSLIEFAGSISDELGELPEYFLVARHKNFPFLTPAQQEILDSKLSELPPEGYVTQKELCKMLDVGQSSMQHLINKSLGRLGGLKNILHQERKGQLSRYRIIAQNNRRSWLKHLKNMTRFR